MRYRFSARLRALGLVLAMAVPDANRGGTDGWPQAVTRTRAWTWARMPALCASLMAVAGLALALTPGMAAGNVFSYTGGSQTYVVPTGVREVLVRAEGADGGDGGIGSPWCAETFAEPGGEGAMR